jgi:hypothetical protein
LLTRDEGFENENSGVKIATDDPRNFDRQTIEKFKHSLSAFSFLISEPSRNPSGNPSFQHLESKYMPAAVFEQ